MKPSKLFNPFEEIAGAKALFFGFVVMLITGLTGYFSFTHFPDMISIKYIPEYLPLSYYFVQQVVIWLIPSLIFYVFALIGSSSSVRVVDIFGTMALARFPYIIAAVLGFSGSMKRFGDYLMALFMEHDTTATISTFDIVTAIVVMFLMLLLTVWLVALMYNAFRISSNLKGGKAVGLFIAGLFISIIATMLVNIWLYGLWA
ncbi:hypothetical protein [Marinilabilia sp.]|uniref:hypothetical protein n=1 Tax=Marinilabilia sp. TaxID=2021252 RepID=UPI0025BD5CEE|nr:hypothetical protein [Marinilabilia sp.]